jgi:hypothetical protein
LPGNGQDFIDALLCDRERQRSQPGRGGKTIELRQRDQRGTGKQDNYREGDERLDNGKGSDRVSAPSQRTGK